MDQESAKKELIPFSRLITNTWNSFWKYFNPLLAIFSFIFLISILLSFLLYGPDGYKVVLNLPFDPDQLELKINYYTSMLIAAVNGLIIAIGTGTAIFLISGQVKLISQSISKLRTRLVPYVIASFLMSIIILAGFVAIIIPGLIFGVWFAFTEYVLLLENKPPIDALKRSKQLSQGVFYPILWRLLGFYLLFFIIASIINSVSVVGPMAVSIIMSPFAIVYLYELYQDLKKRTKTSPA